MPPSDNPYESPKAGAPKGSAQDKWQRWARIREGGRSRYIWKYGVLFWGLMTAVLWSLWMGWSQGWARLPYYAIGALIIFPACGYLWGTFMWSKMEKQYKSAIGESA